MATPTLATNATEAEAIAYLNAFWGSVTYQNATSTPYNGMTAAQIYAYIAAQHPTGYTPYQYAQAASDVMLSSEVGSAAQQGANSAGAALGGTDTGIQTANLSALSGIGAALSGIESAFGGIASFFGDFTQVNTWLRVAKVIIGGVLIIVGAANLMGAKQVVGKVAKAAPLLAA